MKDIEIKRIAEEIKGIMEGCGISTDEELTLENIESIRFIATVFEIENHFDIYIPDEMLDARLLGNLELLSTYIYETKEHNY